MWVSLTKFEEVSSGLFRRYFDRFGKIQACFDQFWGGLGCD